MHLAEIRQKFRGLLDYLEGDAELTRVIKEEMTEGEAKRAVKAIAKKRIAERARVIQRTTCC